MNKIAVVGIGAIFSHARSPAEFWNNICLGRDLIEDVPEDHWLFKDYLDPIPGQQATTYCKRGSFLPYVSFNPIEFGIPPDRLASIAPSQLLALLAMKQVFEDVTQHQDVPVNLDRTGIILGATAIQEIAIQGMGAIQRPLLNYVLSKAQLTQAQYNYIGDEFEKIHTKLNESTFPGLLSSLISGRSANRFNLGGMNFTVDAACASSLAAVDLAIDKLLNHQVDMMIAGGSDMSNDPTTFVLFSKTPALSPTGKCRPFSEYGDGIVLGEGVGLIALKRLDDAVKDNNKIYAVLNGSGSSSDGRVKSIYSPYSEGQVKALKRCYENAGVNPETIDLIEGHGTSTIAGDREEITALKQLFSERPQLEQETIALGSIKSQIGHTKAAAGIAGLLKVVLSLHHKIIPPTLNVDKPHALLREKDHPFYITEKALPWFYKGRPRRGSVSAFGFGGINYHITLESYDNKITPYFERTRDEKLFVFSATTVDLLIEKIVALKQKILNSPQDLDRLEYESWCSEDSGIHKIAIVCLRSVEIPSLLDQAIDCLKNDKKNPNIMVSHIPMKAKIAFLFPGHGSQYKNMGFDLLMGFQELRNRYDFASGFEVENGLQLQEIIFNKNTSEELLTQTQYAQPAIIATTLLYHDFMSILKIEPDFLIGHSLGELTALYAAGAFDRNTLLEISKDRGHLMGSYLNTNEGMLVVFENPTIVYGMLEDFKMELEISNYNSPKQTVVCGSDTLIAQFEQILDKTACFMLGSTQRMLIIQNDMTTYIKNSKKY